MNDCTRIAPLLEVYADDEASAETNAIVLDHVQRCERCARELRGIVALGAGLRGAIGAGRAPAALHGRIVAAIEGAPPAAAAAWSQPGRWGRLARWLMPASAALVAVAIWMARERPVEAHVQAAVDNHVACALQQRGPRLSDAVAAERGLVTSMPWISDAARGIRIADAHTCGGERPFAHVVFEVDGSTASILIAPRQEGENGSVRVPIVVRGKFDIWMVAGARHMAYVIAERRDGEEMPASVLTRVKQFLDELEATP